MIPTAEWASRLREEIAQHRSVSPLPERESLSPADEQRCRIVGGTFIAWLDAYGPQFLQERSVMAHMLGVDPEPFIVFTSDTPGLVAAQEILGNDEECVAFMFEHEYKSSPTVAEDPDFTCHIHFWSAFRDGVESAIEDEAKNRFPISADCVYWQHSEGTMWGVNCGRGVDHLWQWDGQRPELLEEAISHWMA
jgi:hypothetical protein